MDRIFELLLALLPASLIALLANRPSLPDIFKKRKRKVTVGSARPVELPPASPASPATPAATEPSQETAPSKPVGEILIEILTSLRDAPDRFDVDQKRKPEERQAENGQTQQQRPQAQVQELPRASPPDVAEQEAERFINLAFRRAGAHQVVPWQESLKPNDPDYELRINIGALLPDRIPDGRATSAPSPFPSSVLPPDETGHWLEVVTASGDFFVAAGAKARLFLPREGESWVCDCDPTQPHRCSKETRQLFLRVSLLTPDKQGDMELRVGIYFKNNLLQSCRVTTRISSTTVRTVPQSVITDFTINGKLTSLTKLGSKALNIPSARIKGGDQSFIVNGDFEDVVEFRLAEGQLGAAGDAARARLRDIHMEEQRTFLGRTRFISKLDANNGKSKAEFINDLRETAPLGAQLLTSLFQQPELRSKLKDDVLREPSVIQIARASTNFVFPWGLVYDIPLQPTEASRHRPCKIVEDWQDGKGLPVEGLCKCPHEAQHDLNTLCPFGFWGLRHIIEQPPSVALSDTLASEIRVTAPPPRLFVCTSADLESEYTALHLAKIKGDLRQFGVVPCDTKAALLQRLRTVDPGVIYFYCHGGYQPLPGSKTNIPFLGIGSGERLMPADVVATLNNAAAALYWELANPLVFINGCHTVEVTTDVLVNFVDTFAGFYSSGVVGTEVAVHQSLANEFGAAFLEYFSTETAGEALRHARNRLLCKGNLMGLAYSAYCLSALRIADTARLTAANAASRR